MANVRVIDKYYMGPIFPELPEVLIAKANYELTVKRNGMEILCFFHQARVMDTPSSTIKLCKRELLTAIESLINY